LSTTTVASPGARMLCCGCTKPPWILMRPTTSSLCTSVPWVARQSMRVPEVGALIEILSPSICALSVVT
jgi:hypothetical protein